MVKPRVAFVGPLERVLSLRALPMLERLSADELTAIAQHARERTFPKGVTLVEPGKPTTAAYVVLDGRVLIRRPNGVEVVNPMESVGFVDLLARSVTGLDATAEIDTQTLELDWEAQLDVCEQYFTILVQYIGYLCERAVMLANPITDPPAIPLRGVRHLNRALNIVERALAFGQSPIFATCSPDALWELMRHVREIKFGENEVVWETGDSAHSFLMVVNGTIRCDGTSGMGHTATPGSIVGMFEAMSTQRRGHRAVTTSPATVLSVDDDSFLDILEDHFDMAVEYTAAIARLILNTRPSANTPITTDR